MEISWKASNEVQNLMRWSYELNWSGARYDGTLTCEVDVLVRQ